MEETDFSISNIESQKTTLKESYFSLEFSIQPRQWSVRLTTYNFSKECMHFPSTLYYGVYHSWVGCTLKQGGKSESGRRVIDSPGSNSRESIRESLKGLRRVPSNSGKPGKQPI